ncbi:MAG: hypothetical protein IJ040_04010 [Lachnospiraceae bacterium]|nr:hypothetical protein [Lachnospiraceae bacterium]
MHNINRSKRLTKERSDQFWKQEADADNTRKKDISSLDYIYIPIETLPFGVDTTKEVAALEDTLRRLDSTKILNLSAYTNTELKLEYGVANLSYLSECDERFTLLIRTLYQWAVLLQEHDFINEAVQVAEYSIEIGSDISGCYYMLADYYQAIGNTEAIQNLQKSADSIQGLQADPIKDYLNKSLA